MAADRTLNIFWHFRLPACRETLPSRFPICTWRTVQTPPSNKWCIEIGLRWNPGDLSQFYLVNFDSISVNPFISRVSKAGYFDIRRNTVPSVSTSDSFRDVLISGSTRIGFRLYWERNFACDVGSLPKNNILLAGCSDHRSQRMAASTFSATLTLTLVDST